MRKIITFTAATLLMASAFAAGEVYRWKGPDGTWHYSDQPRPGAELVRRPQLNRPAGEADAPRPVPPPAEEPSATTSETLPVSQEVADEVRAAAAAAKTEQCKKAEATYQESLVARRFTKGKDERGNPVFMNAAEIDNARMQARANRDLACSGGA